MDENSKNYGSVSEPDTIEITLEDLEEESPVYGTVREESTINITWDDLKDIPSSPSGTDYGSVPDYSGTEMYAKKGKKIETQGVVYPALVGLMGGFLAFLINEPFTNDMSEGCSAISNIVEMGMFLGIIGAFVSGALSIVEDIKSFVFEKAAKHFFCGVFAGFVTGFIGGIIAQIIFGIMTAGNNNIAAVWFARVIGWAIAGAFVGLSQSLAEFKFNEKRLKNGLLGGVIGGAIGGILFDPISVVFGALGNHGTHGGWISRMVGISVMGAAIGCAIGFISESLKQAWIFITEGPLKGKQFILYESVTSFGSSPKCSITIAKDPGFAENHFCVENHGTYFRLVAMAPVQLNGRDVRENNLKDGDIIRAGKTVFRYEKNILNKK